MGHNAVKNKVRLKICDIECTVSTEDQEDYVRSLGFDVQRTIQGLMGQNGRVSLAMAATIAALSYCDEVHKEIVNSDNLRSQIKQYCDEAMQAKEDLERLQVENEKLRSDLDEAHAEASKLRIQLGAADSILQAKSRRPAVQDLDEPIEEPAAADFSEQLPEDEAQEAPSFPQPVMPKRIEGGPHAFEVALLEPEEEAVTQTPKLKAIPRPIPPQAPLHRSSDVPPLQAGPYSRPKSPFEPDLPSADGFVSFFEKK